MQNPATVASGFGLRKNHINDFLNKKIEVDLFEVIAENYIIHEGNDYENLIQISQKYPLHLHGVSLNIGSYDPLNLQHLEFIKKTLQDTQAFLFSDHLCWNTSKGRNTFELMPLPHTQEAITHASDRIKQVQDFLGRNFALENISTYFRYQSDELSEFEFLAEIVEKTGVQILLDINNAHINAFNHNFNIETEIKKLNPNSVVAYHLAGHEDFKTFKFDSHSTQVPPEVWNLFEYCIQYFGTQPTIIERDENIPEASELEIEAQIAKKILLKHGSIHAAK